MQWKKSIEKATVLIIIMVFAYTGIAKIWGYEQSLQSFLNQPLPNEWGYQLAIVVPLMELITMFLLLFTITRRIGLVFALVIMTVFTTYASLVLMKAFDRTPCSCGGIFESMSWELHWFINIVLTILISIILIFSDEMFSKKEVEQHFML